MAKQRVVNTHFWNDDFILDLEPNEKLLFLYILTNPQTDICGAYQIAIKRIAFDTGLKPTIVYQALSKFEAAGKIVYKDGWMIVQNFARHQINNPKVQKGIERSLSTCPDWVKDRLSIDYQSLRILKPKLKLKPEPKPEEREAAKPPARAPEPEPDSIPVTDLSQYEEEMVQVYHEFFPDHPLSPFLQDLIYARVDDVTAWRKALTYWQYNSYRPSSVGKICDYYDELKAGKTNGTNFNRIGKRTDADVLKASADFYANYPDAIP